MTTVQLKARVKKLVDKEHSNYMLRSVEALLRSETKEAAMRRRLIEAAERSEEDLKAGRVHSWEEVEADIDKLLAAKAEPRTRVKRNA